MNEFEELHDKVSDAVRLLRDLKGSLKNPKSKERVQVIYDMLNEARDFDVDAVIDELQAPPPDGLDRLNMAIAERRTYDAHEILRELFPTEHLMHPRVTETLFPERIED